MNRLNQFLGILVGYGIFAGIAFGIFRILWVIGSSPTIIKGFFENGFLLGIAAAISAVGAFALVVVTWRLVIVTHRLEVATEVQTHANTAPLLLISASVDRDPPDAPPQPGLLVPSPYAFESGDIAEREYAAFLGEPEPPFKQYLLITVGNTQTTGSYGIAMNIEIDVVLYFPKIAFVRTHYRDFDPDQLHSIHRTLRFEAIFGNYHSVSRVFRVDPLPQWNFLVEAVRFQNFRGKNGTFAVGTKAGLFLPDTGLSVTFGKFDPLPGEIPS